MSTFERYLAIDLHKHYVVVGGVSAQQKVALPPGRLDLHEWPHWRDHYLQVTDAVVIEATTNAWDFYDQLVPRVGRVVVANPGEVELIAHARIKTDRQDVLRLAHLLAADLIPEVWVPPLPVRELRALLAHRRRLVKMRTMCSNRLQSLIHRDNFTPPSGELFSSKKRPWWEGLAISPVEHLRVRHDLATRDHLDEHIQEMDTAPQRLSTSEPWRDYVPYLVQLPSFGVQLAMTVLASIGDVMRFPTGQKLVGYAGLGTCVHDSGETHRTGHITKEGRREHPSLLETRISAPDSPDGLEPRHRCHRAQIAGRGVACADGAHHGPPGGSRHGRLQVDDLVLEAQRRRARRHDHATIHSLSPVALELGR